MHQAPSLVFHYAQDTVMLEVNSLKSHQVQKPNEFKPTINCDVKIKILEWDFINFVTL